MKFGRFIKEHIIWLVIALFLIITIDIFLLTIKGSIYLALYVTFAILLFYFIGMLYEYRRTKAIYEEILINMRALDKKYFVPEILDMPEGQEAELIIDILREAENSMSTNVSAYRRNMEYYKEYIETWVHEVKVPISTAKMILENHKDKPLKDSEIDVEIDRIENYVEQALYYSKSAEVEKDYFIKVIDLEAIVRQTFAKRKKSLIAMKAAIDIHDIDPSVKIRSDGKWLAFILGQIIDNSIKYAKEDERLRFSVYEEVDDQEKRLIIEDNGVGIKSAELSRVFDKGFTGSNGRSGKASTGIGLYLCYRLCKRLEHDLRIESQEGVGTKVIIVF
ncbi:MAG: sensor histidine kinase [Eubacterium sp.]|nr:sensor histidine kinase [Eubacterium sp.]